MANLGASPIDYTSALGLTRLAIGDVDATDVDNGAGTYRLFSDVEITAFLVLGNGSPKRAGARALRQIALSQALLKEWTSADLSVNGTSAAEVVMKLADKLDAEADDDEGIDGSDVFLVVPTGDHRSALGRTLDIEGWGDISRMVI